MCGGCWDDGRAESILVFFKRSWGMFGASNKVARMFGTTDESLIEAMGVRSGTSSQACRASEAPKRAGRDEWRGGEGVKN